MRALSRMPWQSASPPRSRRQRLVRLASQRSLPKFWRTNELHLPFFSAITRNPQRRYAKSSKPNLFGTPEPRRP